MNLITDKDFLNFIGTQESQFILPASTFAQEVIDRFAGKQEYRGDELPWQKTVGKVALRMGEVSVWSGYNGHGKSQLLGMVAAWGLRKKWLIASMEMKPPATMQRIIRQAAGTNLPSDHYVNFFSNWTDNRLWIYDQQDSVKYDRILGMINYAAQELKINHIVIDSLLKCGISSDDYNSQKDFVDRLCWSAKRNDVHIHLVHHMRKGKDEYSMPGKHDLKGTGDIADLVDNIFIVHRNKLKEKKIRNDELVDLTEPDCFLNICKQRGGEWEGTFALWFNPTSLQYVPSHGERIMAHLEMEKVFENSKSN